MAAFPAPRRPGEPGPGESGPGESGHCQVKWIRFSVDNASTTKMRADSIPLESALRLGAQAGVERIPQRVAEEIEPEREEQDRKPGEQGAPGRQLQEIAPFRQHQPQ